MKKTLITALLIVLLSSTGLFAAVSDNFNVTTVVANVDLMTISTTQFTGTTVAAFEALVPFTTLAISGGGAQTFNAWLSTLSNNRAGFKVTMKATAMKSSIAGQADAFINYTVTCNSKSVTTNDAAEVTATSPILTYPSLSLVTKTSNKISLTVIQTDFDKALSGSYTGTVTFIYTAN
ncbi:hypothetical protein [Sphaerochaeta sp. PS]|uniref:hypothetical protein n=1 Tax=Sphaerochaeta sp. PS TaxID=3076336 RepID=UPI0028A3BABC|nr:hypothetical protein [Sphaerochaeta sp. PS]MDT4762582.1 hypothetical protein [Sphaerochaeta sp. PS]